MLAAERRKKIYEMVDEHTAVKVTELSNIFSVTEETIRRDLEKLERENKIKRLHGGAVKVPTNDSEVHFTEREILHVEEKRVVATEAVKLIAEGDKIILDASTTAMFFARCLPNIPITVITNSVQVINELIEKDRIEKICLGGLYSTKTHSFTGPLSERSLENYHVNKAFISCKGVHITNGVRDSNEMQALLKRKMITHCDEAILMVDSSKINAHSFSPIVPLSDIHTIICDEGIDRTFKQQAEEIGVNVTIASL
nr:DeoR/GlpR family DNA-binding transcription regulator [Lysinibacillus timonensis]